MNISFDNVSRSDPYTLALERERVAWEALHVLKRTDPGYAHALAEWRAAADSISIAAAESLIKTRSPMSSSGVRAAAKISRSAAVTDLRDSSA